MPYNAWSNVPPTAGSDMGDFAQHWQFYLAMKERWCANGIEFFPPVNVAWAEGTITGITDDGTTAVVTDSTANWTVPGTCGAGSSAKRWVAYMCGTDTPWLPQWYDLIVDGNEDADTDGFYLEPHKVVRVAITDNTTTTLNTGTFADWVTWGNIPSVASLVGKRYFIIKQNQAFWWHERGMDWPPSWLFSWGLITSATHGSLSDDHQAWAPDRWKVGQPGDPGSPATFDVVLQADDGRWKRVKITGNELIPLELGGGATLKFAPQSWTPAVGGRYGIVGAGGIFKPTQVDGDRHFELDTAPPSKASGTPTLWYAGYTKPYWSHYPKDVLHTTEMPSTTFTHQTLQGSPPTCQDFTETSGVFDADWQYEIDDECETANAGDFLRQRFWSTYRAQQHAAVAEAGNWLDPTVTYEGRTQRYIDEMTPAELFKAGAVNTYTTTVASVVTTLGSEHITYSPVGLPYVPIEVNYTIVRPDGAKASGEDTGTITITSDGTIPINVPNSPAAEDRTGRTLIIAIGFTRRYDYEFLYFYDETDSKVFVADFGFDEGDPPAFQIYDPPEDEDGKAGRYEGRGGASTHYREHDAQGFVTEGGVAFASGDVARYVGDNFNDASTLQDLYECSDSRPSCQYPDTKYIDHWWTGQTYRSVVFGDSGAATSGGSYFLRDTTKHWYQDWWTRREGKGLVRTETGTATGGGTTTLIDTAKSTSNFWVAATGRYVGFILEMTSGANAGERRPITAFNEGTQTLTVSPAFPSAVAAGATYQIKEPYRINRWVGRTLRVTQPDGTTKDATILYSDDDTIYFSSASGVTATVGTSYQIVERKPGDCFKWNGSAWVTPTGTDARSGLPFIDNQAGIQPFTFVRYGYVMKGDHLTIETEAEIRRLDDKLYLKKVTGSWTPRGEHNVDLWTNDTFQYASPGYDTLVCGTCNDVTGSPFWCTWDAGFTWATSAYEGDLVDPYPGPPSMVNAGCHEPGSACFETGVGGAIFRNYAYYDGGYGLFCRHEPMTVTLYVRGIKPTPPTACDEVAFESGGAPISDGSWTSWDTVVTDDDGNWLSDKFGEGHLGPGSKPPNPPEPDGADMTCTDGHCIYTGYDVEDALGIIDFREFFRFK